VQTMNRRRFAKKKNLTSISLIVANLAAQTDIADQDEGRPVNLQIASRIIKSLPSCCCRIDYLCTDAGLMCVS
jgi:hypothetical protein